MHAFTTKHTYTHTTPRKPLSTALSTCVPTSSTSPRSDGLPVKRSLRPLLKVWYWCTVCWAGVIDRMIWRLFSTLPSDYDMEVIEASASTGSNVNEVFVSLGRTILLNNRAVSLYGWIDRWMYGLNLINGKIGGWMDGCIEWWMKRWIKGMFWSVLLSIRPSQGLAQVETQESSEGSLILKEFAAKKKKKQQRSNDCCLLC